MGLMTFYMHEAVQNNINSKNEPIEWQCAEPTPDPEISDISERKCGVYEIFDEDVAYEKAA